MLVDSLLYHLGPDNSDMMIWPISSFGSATTQNSYSQLRRKQPKVSWGSWIWSSFIPPRKSLTVWRAIHNKLPTWDNLFFMGPSICPLCLKAEENVDHLFVYCDFAQLLWTKVLSAFNISIQEPSSFGQFCLSAMKTIVSPQLLSLWRFVLLMAFGLFGILVINASSRTHVLLSGNQQQHYWRILEKYISYKSVT